jgi:hypothetical protein
MFRQLTMDRHQLVKGIKSLKIPLNFKHSHLVVKGRCSGETPAGASPIGCRRDVLSGLVAGGTMLLKSPSEAASLTSNLNNAKGTGLENPEKARLGGEEGSHGPDGGEAASAHSQDSEEVPASDELPGVPLVVLRPAQSANEPHGKQSKSPHTLTAQTIQVSQIIKGCWQLDGAHRSVVNELERALIACLASLQS